MASTSKPFKKALIKASKVFKFNLDFLSDLTEFCFEKPYSQMAMLEGITSTYCYKGISVGQLSINLGSDPQKAHASCSPCVGTLMPKSPQIQVTPHCNVQEFPDLTESVKQFELTMF